MNVSSAATSTATSYGASSNSSEITQLQKQKADFQKEIQTENQSKDDAKTKEQKVQQLQQQIQQVDMEISRIKSEKTEQQGQGIQKTASTPPKSSKLDVLSEVDSTLKSSDLEEEKASGNIIDVQV